MPLTFPAHQGLVASAKLRWPHLIDGTALCIGAATPDMAYSIEPWSSIKAHTTLGLVLWAIPFTLIATHLTRWRAAAGIFAHLPDLGPLRLRSYRVLTQQRPSHLVTLASTVLGAGSALSVTTPTSGRPG